MTEGGVRFGHGPAMNTDNRVADVVIVGYGPVGATAANLLGGMGLDVVVIEREPSPYARARAISTDEEVIRVWQQTGLAEQLKAEMLSERPIDFVDEKGRSFLSLAPVPRGNNHPSQLFIYQPAVEQTLRQGVDRYTNVQVLLEHESTAITQDLDTVTLTLTDLGDHSTRTLRARYVIACDGGSSRTRTSLGIGFEGRSYEDKWLVIDTKVRSDWPTHDRLRFHCDPKRPAVDCPTPLGHHRWEFPVLPGEDEGELATETSVWKLLDGHGIGPDQVEILRSVVYTHHVRFATHWRDGRIFLAGDAAHVMPPWIGQGMAAGIRDTGNLCWKLAGVLRGDLPPEALDSYETERQPHVRAVTAKAIFFGRVITERRRIVALIRNPAFRIAKQLPILGPYLRDARWFPNSHYSSGYLAVPPRADQARAKAVGWLIPQPFVNNADGQRVRFDDGLGAGWCLLHRTPDASEWKAWLDAGIEAVELRAPGAKPAKGALVDTDGTLTSWMTERQATALVIRPDRFVYAAAGPDLPLPRPPPGFKLRATGRERHSANPHPPPSPSPAT
jgi:3-(3-hydroxy-phenyl)propionate hydroxylase